MTDMTDEDRSWETECDVPGCADRGSRLVAIGTLQIGGDDSPDLAEVKQVCEAHVGHFTLDRRAHDMLMRRLTKTTNVLNGER